MLWSTSSLGVAVRPTSSESNQSKIAPVLLVDRAVRLVDHHEVEVAGTECPYARVGVVDQVHHRRVGADVHPPVGDLLGHQVHGGGIGQMRLERVGRLVDQSGAVGQEQHAS